MFEDFTVLSAIHNYTVNFVKDFIENLQNIIQPEDTILIDSNIYRLYFKQLKPILTNSSYIQIEATEEKKSYKEVGLIIEQLIQNGFRRNNNIIAIGGGITQDISAFIAANLYRGVNWYFFPTTLLAQADSCIGGKSSINFGQYKNLLGNFYPPKKIFIDLSFIDTLDRKEFISGLGEITHFYFVSGIDDYIRIRDQYDKALIEKTVLEGLIHRSLTIKKTTIEIDEFDKKERLLFNYGHSFGHAIESITDYRVPHGIAVTYGMDIANYISLKMGYIDEDLFRNMHEVLKLNWREKLLGTIDIHQFIEALRKDKKNIGKNVRVILTRGFGKMFIDTIDINEIAKQYIEEYFNKQVFKE